jgi:hypothetical protein
MGIQYRVLVGKSDLILSGPLPFVPRFRLGSFLSPSKTPIL